MRKNDLMRMKKYQDVGISIGFDIELRNALIVRMSDHRKEARQTPRSLSTNGCKLYIWDTKQPSMYY